LLNYLKEYNLNIIMNNTVSKIIYNYLSKNMSTAYIYSGGSIMTLLNHFSENKIKYFVPSSEMSSGFCSIGHNKLLNKCDSVVITTSGPGLTNTITSITDAYCDQVPLLVISGDVSTDMMGKHSFQEAPSIELTKHITTWNYTLYDENEVEDVMETAIYLVNNNKQVHLNIPKDIINKTIKYNKTINYNNKEIKNNIPLHDIIKISNIINNSKKPVFYIGRGCRYASEILTKIAFKANIPVTTTLHGLGIFNENSYLSLKMVGMHGSERANHAIQLSDCIICVGARFDDRTVGNINKYAPNAKNIIHINNNLSVFNKVIKNTINIYGDSLDILTRLNEYIIKKFNDKWIYELDNYFKFFKSDNILNQQYILLILNRLINKENSIIITGVGNHQMYTAQFINHQYPNRFITSGSLGTMGSCNSMAIGAKIANPDKIIIAIDGDQSFNMMSDLKMILNYNIGIKIIIMNDGKQSMVNVWEKIFYNNNIIATESINPNYKDISKAYNIKYIKIDKIEDVLYKIKLFLDYDINKSIILDCNVSSDYCLPFVPPGSALNEMITIDNINNFIPDNNIVPN